MDNLFKRRPGYGHALAAISLALFVIASPAATAEEAATSTQAAQIQHDYSITAGPLRQALLQFGEQSGGLQLVAPSSLTEALQTPGLSGRYTVQEGLSRLLAATGLSYRFNSPTSFTLFRADADKKQTLLDSVRVEGTAATGYGGINGSTDVTATEGSGSYTTPKLNVGGKIATSIKDTPQSVSVITQTQMQDQRINNLTEALEKSTGVTVQTVDGRPRFYARGIEITRVQIDGNSPLDISVARRQNPSIDMALYDHVEVLRGPDGLFNGNAIDAGQNSLGGGVINLVRKRPLDHAQVVFESTAGSWNNFRNVLDLTGPLALDGGLRGRVIAVSEFSDYFYDESKLNKKVLYGTLESDLGEDTQLRVGASHTNERSNPFTSGLPRYTTGADLHLSRSFSTVMPWDKQRTLTNEVFAQLDHRFNANWALRFNANKNYQRENALRSTLIGLGVDDNGDGLIMSSTEASSRTRQLSLDSSLSGNFEWWGLPQQFVFGGNYKKLNGTGTTGGYLDSPAINVWNFSRSSISRPVELFSVDEDTAYEDKQWGSYAWINLMPVNKVHFKTGIRYNYNRSLYTSQESAFEERKLQKPYYALAYDLAPDWTLYASYTDINQSQTSMITESGSPLKPMVGSNKEIGIKFGSERLTASLAAYRLLQKNAALNVDFAGFGIAGASCCFVNDTATRISTGIELEVAGEVSRGWQVAGGYTFNANKTRDDTATSGKRFSTITPRHLLKLVSSYQFRDDSLLRGWKAGGSLKAQSSSFTTGTLCADDFCSETFDYQFTQGGYAAASIFASYRVDKTWTLQLNVDNLFDRTYYETTGSTTNGNYYAAPRNFKATLRGTF